MGTPRTGQGGHNRVAIVTGGFSGIGRAIADKFLEEGYMVFSVDREIEVASITRAENLVEIQADLENLREIPRIFRTISSSIPRGVLSIALVNNVGNRSKQGFLEESVESWNEALSTSLSAPFFMATETVKMAIKFSAATNLCNISSILATLVGGQPPSYSVSKAGLDAITRYFAANARRVSVPLRSIGVAPGLVIQNRHLEKYFHADNSEWKKLTSLAHPGAGFATAEDVADLVYWLTELSPQFLNGQTLTFDGGLTIQDPLHLVHEVERQRRMDSGD